MQTKMSFLTQKSVRNDIIVRWEAWASSCPMLRPRPEKQRVMILSHLWFSQWIHQLTSIYCSLEELVLAYWTPNTFLSLGNYRYRPNWLTSFWTQLMCLEMGLALPTITFHLRRSVRDKPTSRCKTTLWMLTILSYKPVIPGVAFIWQINKKVIKITFQSWILYQNHSVNDISLSFQVQT